MIPDIELIRDEITGDLIHEIWKPIAGYEGLYDVSNYGRIKSLDRVIRRNNGANNKFMLKGKLLQPATAKKGFLYLMLNKCNTQKTSQVSRLVAIHFVDNPNLYPQVNHIDYNKKNNFSRNLEWTNNRENQTHKHLMLKRKTSKFIGVRWDAKRKMWRADIQIEGISKYLGHHEQEIDAALAYRKSIEANGLKNKYADHQI